MNLLWALLCIGAACLAQSLVLGRFSLRRLTCARRFSRRSAFEGESVEMIEVIRNLKRLPVPWIRLESRVSGDLLFGKADQKDTVNEQYHRSFFYLAGRQQVTRRHAVRCRKRGYYDLSSVSVTAGDLLGMHSSSRTMDMNLHLSVYPRLLPQSALPTPATRWLGDMLVRRWIHPDPFLYGGIRDYRAGDALRDIHWRATAASGALMVKQPDHTASPRAMILLNTQPSEHLWGEVSPSDQPLIEYGISMCATLLLRALDAGVEAGLACNGRLKAGTDPFVPPASGRAQRERLLEYCARIEVSRALNFHTFLSGIAPRLTGQDILVVSAYRDELMEDALARLRGQGNTVSFVALAQPQQGRDAA